MAISSVLGENHLNLVGVVWQPLTHCRSNLQLLTVVLLERMFTS